MNLHLFPMSNPPGCAEAWRVLLVVGSTSRTALALMVCGLTGAARTYPPKPRRYRPVILPISPAFAGRTALHGLGLWNEGKAGPHSVEPLVIRRAEPKCGAFRGDLHPIRTGSDAKRNTITRILGTSRPCTGSVCPGKVQPGRIPAVACKSLAQCYNATS